MTELKKFFENAECEVVNFAVEDIVTTSQDEPAASGGVIVDPGDDP